MVWEELSPNKMSQLILCRAIVIGIVYSLNAVGTRAQQAKCPISVKRGAWDAGSNHADETPRVPRNRARR